MRTGKLHLPSYVCGPSVKHEFNYWGLSPKKIEQCCWLNYNDWNVTHEAILRLEHDRKVSLQSRGNCCEGNDQWNAGTWWRKKWQCKMWRFLNWPNSSNGARVRETVMVALKTSLVIKLILMYGYDKRKVVSIRRHVVLT